MHIFLRKVDKKLLFVPEVPSSMNVFIDNTMLVFSKSGTEIWQSTNASVSILYVRGTNNNEVKQSPLFFLNI